MTTFWLTGLSASGKTTLANGLGERLVTQGRPCQIVDGDALRLKISADLGFSRADRSENIRRAANVCHQLNADGLIAIAALISPYSADRAMARSIIGESAFHEIFVQAPLAVCEQRDPKGLYQRARRGDLANFTGVGAPYEPPENPKLLLQTHQLGVEACLDQIMSYMEDHNL